MTRRSKKKSKSKKTKPKKPSVKTTKRDTAVSQSLEIAEQHLQAGRLAEVEGICRQILNTSPREHGAYRLLGGALFLAGKHEQALAHLQQAIRLSPRVPEYHDNLSVIANALGRADEAEAAARGALALRPDFAEAENSLGSALKIQGRLEEAEQAFGRALAIRPDDAKVLNNLGNTLKAQGRLAEAEQAYRRSLTIRPNHAGALNNLGIVLQSQGRLEDAVEAFHRALAIDSGYAAAENNLGNTLKDQGRLQEAAETYRRALQLDPNFLDALVHLAIVLLELGQLEESERTCRRALAIKPDDTEAENNLGNTLKSQGRLEEAIQAYKRALVKRPDFDIAHSNLLLTEQYRPGVTPAGLATLHAKWDQRHAEALRNTWQPPTNDPDPDRRLRLGFVSPDLWRHPVGYYFVRVLENLEPRGFETFCYSDRTRKDALSTRIAAAAGSWRETKSLSSKALAEEIRSDGIDILFDLAGHTAGNRLGVFALKPAPIQISWIGYLGTTGMAAMDYLIADRFLVPQEMEEHYRERIIRLPDCYVCYDPPTDAPQIGPLPALTEGHVTFGSFNNLAKITPEVVSTWSEILLRIPSSRLVLKYRGLGDEHTRRQFTERFSDHGVDPDRLELLDFTSFGKMFEEYNRIDLALDPFPFTGGTTTCLALWMGVPVLSVIGETFAGRLSLSLLSNVGLIETIAKDRADYVQIAVRLAQDLPQLGELRAGLPEQVEKSPLCDGKRFAENLMESLRTIWQEWSRKVCSRQQESMQ